MAVMKPEESRPLDPSTPLSEPVGPIVGLETKYRVTTVLDVPAIAPESNMGTETHQDKETDAEPGETEPTTDVGSTRLSIRLETARQAQKLLEDPTLGLNERLKIMATIEKLTVGAKGRGKAKDKSKSGLFSK